MSIETGPRAGDELAQVAEWVYGLLSTDAALAEALGVPLSALPGRVWPDVAPSGTAAPWVVFSATDALDVLGIGAAARVFTAAALNVRVVTIGRDPGAASPAARRLYALLHGNHNAPLVGGGTILTCRRTEALNYGETAGGIDYRHTGGLFAVEVN